MYIKIGIGHVVGRLFSLMEFVTAVTNVTNLTDEELIPISSQEVADPLKMTPQAVGQILKTLGLQTKVALERVLGVIFGVNFPTATDFLTKEYPYVAYSC